MSQTVSVWKSALSNYAEVFDFFYTDDEEFSHSHFTPMPEGIPTVRIIDPSRQTGVLKQKPLREDQDDRESTTFPFKTIVPVMPNQIPTTLPKIIEKFIDGELRHYFEQESFGQWHKPNERLVREVTADNFEEIVLKDENIEQFIIEVYGKTCPGCAVSQVIFTALSEKLKKHGYSQQLPCFKICDKNNLPFLGNFMYTPQYLFVKKDKATGKIAEV